MAFVDMLANDVDVEEGLLDECFHALLLRLVRDFQMVEYWQDSPSTSCTNATGS
jgi:hypothetical protein